MVGGESDGTNVVLLMLKSNVVEDCRQDGCDVEEGNGFKKEEGNVGVSRSVLDKEDGLLVGDFVGVSKG